MSLASLVQYKYMGKILIFAALFGVWRSWLAHLLWEQRVESSSLFTPTIGLEALAVDAGASLVYCKLLCIFE